MSKLKKFFTKKKCLVLLSLTATPFILFIMTSLDLYLRNREDFDDRLIILMPFVVIFFAVTFVGYLLYMYAEKSKVIKLLLYIYYLLGPTFLIYSSLRQTQLDAITKGLMLSVLFGFVLIYLYKKVEVSKAVKVFLWLALLMIMSELFTIYKNVYMVKPEPQKSGQEITLGEKSIKKDLPNVYHIILDEYQTDMFDLTLDQATKDKLGGFTYYPETTTLYGRTGMSLPSIFSGKSYDYKMPQIEYQKQAFNSDRSILYWLKKAGYRTDAYIHKVFTFNTELFDSVTENKENASLRISDTSYIKLFASLWLYSNAPKAVTKKVIKPNLLDQIKNQNVLSDAAPILSYESFRNISDNKKLLDRPNQYLFLHLLLPHFPYVLKSDCSYNDAKESSPLEQSKCATKMITEFTKTLKKIGRFDNSLIIIQSDHGARFKVENGKLVNIEYKGTFSKDWSLARSRALLLIKTPDGKSKDALTVSDKKTSLLDIAPTIMDATGTQTDLRFEGFSLNNPSLVQPKRIRYYHFYNKKGAENDRTDELSRYIIGDNSIKFEKKIRF